MTRGDRMFSSDFPNRLRLLPIYCVLHGAQ
ncbi:Uncharacterised protein [Vibrio cholerae]|nr:Uncharacterised protein [Vibrio cholerae]